MYYWKPANLARFVAYYVVDTCKDESLSAVVIRDSQSVNDAVLQKIFRALKAGGKLVLGNQVRLF